MKIFFVFIFLAFTASSAKDCKCDQPIFNSVTNFPCNNLKEIFSSKKRPKIGGPRSLIESLEFEILEYSGRHYFSRQDACYHFDLNKVEIAKNNSIHNLSLELSGMLTDNSMEIQICECQTVPSASSEEFCSTGLPKAISSWAVAIKDQIVKKFGCS